MDRNFDRITENAFIEAAFKRAEAEVKADEIKLEDFKNAEGYKNEEVERDLAEVQRLNQIFTKKDSANPENIEARRLGTIFERILHDQAEMGDWLGPDAVTIRASKFDDYVNGVDDIVESKDSHFALAIDATIGGDSVSKLRRIKDEIDAGKLGDIKYFYSEQTGFRGMLPNIPRVVIGVDGETIGDLVNLWMDGDKKALGMHKVQFQILQEIILQAEVFSAYASRQGEEGVSRTYENLAVRIRGIYEEKVEASGVEISDFDSAYNALKFNLKIFED